MTVMAPIEKTKNKFTCALSIFTRQKSSLSLFFYGLFIFSMPSALKNGKIAKKICTMYDIGFPPFFSVLIYYQIALLHTLKWNHFCLHFLFWFWLTLVNTDCGDYNFVVVVPFMPVKADQVLGLTEGKHPVASLNLGINKEEWCFYVPCPRI